MYSTNMLLLLRSLARLLVVTDTTQPPLVRLCLGYCVNVQHEVRPMNYKDELLKEAAGFQLKIKPDPRIHGGDQCPFCGSNVVSYMTGRDEGLEIKGSRGVQSLQCYNCAAQWEEHYALKLTKQDVRKYPWNVLQEKPAGGSPVERAKTWTTKRASEESAGMDYNDNVLDHYGIEKAAKSFDTYQGQLTNLRDDFLDQIEEGLKWVAKGQLKKFKTNRRGNFVTLSGVTFAQASNSAEPDIEEDDLHIHIMWFGENHVKAKSTLLKAKKERKHVLNILSMDAKQVASQCFFEHFHGLVK